jgi:DNA repair protein RecO (recombination protein O)
MATYKDQGIVLRSWKLGETDRILSMLTAGHGKVRAVAKGVRRPGSRFGGRLESYSLVDLEMYVGRTLDGVNQAELVTPHANVRADFVRSACAGVMAEVVDSVAQEGQREPRLFLLLQSALDALELAPPDPTVFLDAFLLRAAASQGFVVHIDTCVACGVVGPHRYLSVVRGGSLCVDDAPPGTKAVPSEVVELLRLLASDRWSELGRVAVDHPGRAMAASYIKAFVEHHLDRQMKGYDIVPR